MQCKGDIHWRQRRRKERFWTSSQKSLAIIERQLFGYFIVENSPGQIKDVGALGGMARL
jgi:hypothetical protein